MKRYSGETPQSAAKKSRNRARHSCDTCRIKKAKCDGNDPCQGCLSNNVHCTYTELRKRGLQPGHVQKLQRTCDNLMGFLAMFISENGVDQAEDIFSKVANLKDLERQSLLGLIPNTLSEKLTTSVACIVDSIRASNHNDGNFKGIDSSCQASPEMESRHLGFSSGFDRDLASSIRGLQMTNHSKSDFAAAQKLIGDANVMDLLDIYFAYGHPSYPMIEKSSLIQTAVAEDSFGSSGRRCLLWTVLIYALNMTDLAEQYSDTQLVQVMQRIVFCSLRSRFSSETVQSLLLQSLFLWGKGYWSNSFLLVGDAVRMGIDLGLHIDSAENPAIARRTWKCCCMIDSLVSGRLGRRPQVIHKDYFDTLEPEDSTDEWELWRPPQEQFKSNRSEKSSKNLDEKTAYSERAIIDRVGDKTHAYERANGSNEFFVSKNQRDSPENLCSSSAIFPYSDGLEGDGFNESSVLRSYTASPGRVVSVFNAAYSINRIANKFISKANITDGMDGEMTRRLARNVALELDEWRQNLPKHLDITGYMEMDWKSAKEIQLLPHTINLYFGYVSLCHLLHIIDCELSLSDILPSEEEVIDLARKTMYAFFSRASPRKAIPTFEYFLCLSMTVRLKKAVESQVMSSSLSTDEVFNDLLKYLKICSEGCGGALVSHDYWINIKESGMNGQPGHEIQRNRNYAPYVYSSLHQFDGFPDLETLNPVLGDGRSCIGAMIERLEEGNVVEF